MSGAPFRLDDKLTPCLIAGASAIAVAACQPVAQPADTGHHAGDRDRDRGHAAGDRAGAEPHPAPASPGGGAYVTAAEIDETFGAGDDFMIKARRDCRVTGGSRAHDGYTVGLMQQPPRGQDEEAEFMVYASGDSEWADEFWRLRKVSPHDVEPGMEIVFYREDTDEESLPETLYLPPTDVHDLRSDRMCADVVTDVGWLAEGAVRVSGRDRFVHEENLFEMVPE